MTTFLKYPGFQQTKINSELDRHLENLEILGYSIMENVISSEEAAAFASKLEYLWQKQEEEFGKDRLLELGEYGTHRGLLGEDPAFADIVIHPKIFEVVSATVGNMSILYCENASAVFPGEKHYQTAWHRDFNKDFVATKTLAVNAFWCITDFTAENGATSVVPGTHKRPMVPSESFIEKSAVQIIAPAGSVLFYDSLILHRAGTNNSDKPRYGINHIYTRPFMKQQIDYPAFLKGKYDEESKLGQVLGFWTIPPKSVKEFRVDPDKRTYRRGQG